MNSARTVLIGALFCAYGACALGRLAPVGGRGGFQPFLPPARAVETRIGEGRFAEALTLASDLHQAYPNEPLVDYWLARIHHGLRDPGAEAKAWAQYLAVSAAPQEACPAWPRALAQSGQPAEALSAYERCAALAGDDAERFVDLGDAYLAAGKPADAREAFARAGRLDPENPLPRQRLVDHQ